MISVFSTVPIGGTPSAPIDQAAIHGAIDAALRSTSDAVQQLTQSTPNPTAVAVISGLLRTGLSAYGGALSVYSQTVTGAEWELVSGILCLVCAGCLSVAQKWWAKRKAHEAALASATASAHATTAAGAPVALAVQPT